MLKKEPFNTSKVYYEKALKRSGFRNIKNQEYQLWCSKGKAPVQYLYSNNINKIFNRSTVKVGYCCTQIVGSIVRLHYKQLVGANGQIISSCNCRKTKLYKCVLTQQLVTEKRIYLWPPGGATLWNLIAAINNLLTTTLMLWTHHYQNWFGNWRNIIMQHRHWHDM